MKLIRSGIEPLYNPLTETVEHYKEREDKIAPSLKVGEVLKNSPDQHNQQFRIHAVIEDQ